MDADEEKKTITHLRSAAKPAPTPLFFVGVLTLTKIRSASWMARSMSVEKNKLRPRASLMTSSRPGSYMGRA